MIGDFIMIGDLSIFLMMIDMVSSTNGLKGDFTHENGESCEIYDDFIHSLMRIEGDLPFVHLQFDVGHPPFVDRTCSEREHLFRTVYPSVTPMKKMVKKLPHMSLTICAFTFLSYQVVYPSIPQ